MAIQPCILLDRLSQHQAPTTPHPGVRTRPGMGVAEFDVGSKRAVDAGTDICAESFLVSERSSIE